MIGKDIHEAHAFYYNERQKLVKVCAVKGVFSAPVMKHFENKGISVTIVKNAAQMHTVSNAW